ncbi:MAG: PilZ domain-containing protein [Pirellulales bacterium]
MLETVDFDQRRQLIERIPCRVQLPLDWEEQFEGEGYVASYAGEFRANFRYRASRRAVVQIGGELPAFPRDGGMFGAFVQDFSRRGMGLLYHEQLFPEERVRVLLPSVSVDGTVVRCRRRGPDCYELGLVLDVECRLREMLA